MGQAQDKMEEQDIEALTTSRVAKSEETVDDRGDKNTNSESIEVSAKTSLSLGANGHARVGIANGSDLSSRSSTSSPDSSATEAQQDSFLEKLAADSMSQASGVENAEQSDATNTDTDGQPDNASSTASNTVVNSAKGSPTANPIDSDMPPERRTLLDDQSYTIPPAIAANVLREMMANKPDPIVFQKLEPLASQTERKSDGFCSRYKLKGNGHKKNDTPTSPKFTFPNIADKNFFVPNFAQTSSPHFTFGNGSDSTFKSQQSTTYSSAPQNGPSSLQQKESFANTQWHPSMLDKFSPPLSSKSSSSAAMPLTSVWPTNVGTTSPTDAQFSTNRHLFSQFTGSFNFDLSKSTGMDVRTASPPLPMNNVVTPTQGAVIAAGGGASLSAAAGSTAMMTTVNAVKGTGLGNPAASSSPPFIIRSSSPSGVKKLHIKFEDINISTTQVSPSSTAPKPFAINVPSAIETSPSKAFVANATTNNLAFYRPIRPLPARAKARLSSGSTGNDPGGSNKDSGSGIPPNADAGNGANTQSQLPISSPSPLFSLTTPTHSDAGEDDFEAEDDDGSNDSSHADWLDNANNKKKRKALQTAGGTAIVVGSGGGAIKTLGVKERINPLRRVERRLIQRNNNPLGKPLGVHDTDVADYKGSKNSLDMMRPPHTSFDFSFKQIQEKSAAQTAASVNAASAKRLAAVSPIQPLSSKSDIFTSSTFVQPAALSSPAIPGPKKKVSTKRAAPSSSSALFKTDAATMHNNSSVPNSPSTSTAIKSLPPPPSVTPKRPPNAGRKKTKKKTFTNVQSAQSQHQQHSQQPPDDTSSTSGSVENQPLVAPNVAARRRYRFQEKSGDWICMFCEYRLYYGDGRRTRRKPKAIASNGSGSDVHAQQKVDVDKTVAS